MTTSTMGKKGVEVDGVHCVKCNICNTIERKPKCLHFKWDNLHSMKACERTKKSIEKGPKGGCKILGLVLLSCKKSSIVCSTQERDDDTTNELGLETRTLL